MNERRASPNGALDLPGLTAPQAFLSYTPAVANEAQTNIQLPARQVSASVKRHWGVPKAPNPRGERQSG